MKIFNLDLHISVVADIKQILESQGHEVTSWSLSAHAWVMNQMQTKVDVITSRNWRDLDKGMCQAFYDRYKDELESFDAFLVTHTPAFALLFEQWRKPIICVASTRYEAPFSDDSGKWNYLNERLRALIDEGLLIPIANNKYDAAYAELFTQRSWRVIPSLCAYTGAHYTGARREALIYSKLAWPAPSQLFVDRSQLMKSDLFTKGLRRLGLPVKAKSYEWQDLADFRAVVYVPYNASIMSIFELYTSATPLIMPSLEFAGELYQRNQLNGVFSEVSYNQVLNLGPGSRIQAGENDPNDFTNVPLMLQWFKKSDFYDDENMPHITFFNSFEEVENLIHELDLPSISEQMQNRNLVRLGEVQSAWQEVIEREFAR